MSSAVQNQATRGLASLPRLKVGPYENEPILLAPMAGVSEAPFRVMALEMGAGFTPTELVSSKGLQYENARTQGYLRHDPKLEPQLWVQVFGGDPEAMGVGAELAAARGAKMLDINMGCPVKKVTRNGAGSALMCDPRRAAAIVRAMRERVGDKVPITAKIRGGWDDTQKNAADVGRALEDAGLSVIAIHPRTRRQGYSGSADWDLIAELADAVSIPVVANGDINSADAADQVVEQTGCAAVMIGRAALGNPWIFRQLRARRAQQAAPEEPSPTERAAHVRRHLTEHIEHVGDEDRALKKFRQHLIWYSRGMRGGAAFREHAMQLEERPAIEEAIERFFGSARTPNLQEAAIYDERQAFG